MKNKLSLFLVSLALMLLLGAFEQIRACTCIDTSPCLSYYSADLTFIGKITAVKKELVKIPNSLPEGVVEPVGSKLIKEKELDAYVFKISEIFGDEKKITEVTLLDEPTTCSVAFEKDETYLVYAYKIGDGKYTTDICSGTTKLSNAQESLKFLREILPGPNVEVCVRGALNRDSNNFWAYDANRSFRRIAL